MATKIAAAQTHFMLFIAITSPEILSFGLLLDGRGLLQDFGLLSWDRRGFVEESFEHRADLRRALAGSEVATAVEDFELGLRDGVMDLLADGDGDEVILLAPDDQHGHFERA
jgi:hypothetical protein